MEMIRRFKRKLNNVTRLRMLCLFCVIVMVLGVLELLFEVFLLEYGTGADGKPKLHVYTMSSRHMPIHYWRHRQRYPEKYKEDKNAANCTILPYPGDIVYATPYWQRFLGERFSAYLYTAYWEQRPHPTVSVSLLSTGFPDKVYCKLWFLNEAAPSLVEADTRLLGNSKPGSVDGSEVQTAYSVHCQLKGKVYKYPVAVSLMDTEDCKTINNVLTIVNLPMSHRGLDMGFYKPPPLLPLSTTDDISVGVCVMWPDDEEENAELVAHWFEILRMLGAHRIYISINQAHKRVHDLIHFYEQNGLVLKLAKSRPLSSTTLLALTREQLVQYERTFHTFIYTDCLYQARHLHNYVLMLKPFEIILPDGEDDVWANILLQDRRMLYKQPSDAILVDRWNAAGDDESKEEQDSDEDKPYRSFQNTESISLTKLGAPVSCSDRDGELRNCKIRRVKKSAKFIPYTAVNECTQSKVAGAIQTECIYRPHEMLTTLWFFVDSIAYIALNSLY